MSLRMHLVMSSVSLWGEVSFLWSDHISWFNYCPEHNQVLHYLAYSTPMYMYIMFAQIADLRRKRVLDDIHVASCQWVLVLVTVWDSNSLNFS